MVEVENDVNHKRVIFWGRGSPFLLKYFSKILVKSYASASRLLLEITGSCNIIYNAKIKIKKSENFKDAVKLALSSIVVLYFQ